MPADPPDSQSSFAIVNQAVMSDADFRNAVAPSARRKKHKVFVFVHGFNNNFQESLVPAGPTAGRRQNRRHTGPVLVAITRSGHRL
jgi:esterase/lipase superfamily enzyme